MISRILNTLIIQGDENNIKLLCDEIINEDIKSIIEIPEDVLLLKSKLLLSFEEQLNLYIKYKVQDYHDWVFNNWGTESIDHSSIIKKSKTEIIFRFMTNHFSANILIINILKKHPGCMFKLSFDELDNNKSHVFQTWEDNGSIFYCINDGEAQIFKSAFELKKNELFDNNNDLQTNLPNAA
jgi:hypothetical protein